MGASPTYSHAASLFAMFIAGKLFNFSWQKEGTLGHPGTGQPLADSYAVRRYHVGASRPPLLNMHRVAHIHLIFCSVQCSHCQTTNHLGPITPRPLASGHHLKAEKGGMGCIGVSCNLQISWTQLLLWLAITLQDEST